MKFGLRELVFVLLLMGAPVGAYFWLFQPANQYLQEQEAAVAANRQKLAQCAEAMRVIEDLNAELRRYEEAVSFFESKLPAHHEIHKVLDQVTKVAQEHKLDTRLFETLKAKPFARYSEQPIKMEIVGDFDAYYEFLLAVERMPRITKIKDMKLLKNEKEADGRMQAVFTLSIFFVNEDGKTT
jgi:type IV pilus assembly protein PilO